MRNLFLYLLVILVVALPTPGSCAERAASDPQDNQQARGDLDRDGDIDLVVARTRDWVAKAPPHVLYLNMNGVMIDRTGDFAVGSVDSGDASASGRHVRLADLNNDGWLDVISSTAPGSDPSASIGYPWIYINQCCSAGGCGATSCSTEKWLGLRFENDRIPEMLTGGKERK